MKELQWMGQPSLEFEQIIWVTHDIRFCSALIPLENGQRQEIKDFLFGWDCRYQKSQLLMGNNLNLQSFILPSKHAIDIKAIYHNLTDFLLYLNVIYCQEAIVRINDTGL